MPETKYSRDKGRHTVKNVFYRAKHAENQKVKILRFKFDLR